MGKKTRRILIISMLVISAVLLIALVPTSQANETLGNSEFYEDRLVDVGAYDFVYDTLLPVWLDENAEGALVDTPIDVSASHDDLVWAVEQVVPPEWLQEQTEAAIESLLPYFLGDTDGFTITVPLKDLVDSAADFIKNDILATEKFTPVYERAISFVAGKAEEQLGKLDWAPDITREQIQKVLSALFTQEWVSQQLGEAIDEVTPYLKGETDHFTIRVSAVKIAYQAVTQAVEILTSEEALDYLAQELIGPFLEEHFGKILELAPDITLTLEETISAFQEALPDGWMREQLEGIADSAAAFLKGETESLEVNIDLTDLKAAALGALTAAADKALEAYYNSLPVYSMDEFEQDAQDLPPDTLPDHRVSGMSYQEAVDNLDFDTERLVKSAITDRIPDQLAFTGDDIGSVVGAAGVGLFGDQSTSDHVLGELVAPLIEEHIPETVDLPFGVSLTREEITSAINEALSDHWLRDKLGEIIQTITAYLSGDTDSAEVTIDPEELKTKGLDALKGIASKALEALYNKLPETSMEDFQEEVESLPPNTLPDHRPSGVSFEEAMGMLDIDIPGAIQEKITDLIPDDQTQANSTSLLGDDVGGLLDEVRGWAPLGWTFTEADLNEKLNSDQQQELDDIRSMINSGFTVTEADLEAAIDDEGVLTTMDEASNYASTFRTWHWALLVVPLLLFSLVLVLGRRDRMKSLFWVLGVAFLATLVGFIVMAAIVSTVVEDRIEEANVIPADFQAPAAAIAEKENDLIVAVSDASPSPKGTTFYILVFSGAGLVGLAGWRIAERRRRGRT